MKKFLFPVLVALAIFVASCAPASPATEVPVATETLTESPVTTTEAPTATEAPITFPGIPLREFSEFARTSYADTILWMVDDEIFMARAEALKQTPVSVKPMYVWFYQNGNWRFFDPNNLPSYPEYTGSVSLGLSGNGFPVIIWENGIKSPIERFFNEEEFPDMRMDHSTWMKILAANAILTEANACFPMNDAGTIRLEVAPFTTCPAE